jgi:metal transporter CNNM
MLEEGTDVDREEGIGAINFLTIDDLPASSEGVPIDPASIIQLPFKGHTPQFPNYTRSPDDPSNRGFR